MEQADACGAHDTVPCRACRQPAGTALTAPQGILGRQLPLFLQLAALPYANENSQAEVAILQSSAASTCLYGSPV